MYINHEKKFAFVEMRTVEEASNAMSLDGIVFEVCKTLSLSLSCTHNHINNWLENVIEEN